MTDIKLLAVLVIAHDQSGSMLHSIHQSGLKLLDGNISSLSFLTSLQIDGFCIPCMVLQMYHQENNTIFVSVYHIA